MNECVDAASIVVVSLITILAFGAVLFALSRILRARWSIWACRMLDYHADRHVIPQGFDGGTQNGTCSRCGQSVVRVATLSGATMGEWLTPPIPSPFLIPPPPLPRTCRSHPTGILTNTLHPAYPAPGHVFPIRYPVDEG